MNHPYNAKLKNNAQALRKTMTREERHLWYDFLKDWPQTVRRQKIFGNYIVDFYIESARIVIELDGSQHYGQAVQMADKRRDAYLKELGLTVLRYSNAEDNYDFRGVCEDILNHFSITD